MLQIDHRKSDNINLFVDAPSSCRFCAQYCSAIHAWIKVDILAQPYL